MAGNPPYSATDQLTDGLQDPNTGSARSDAWQAARARLGALLSPTQPAPIVTPDASFGDLGRLALNGAQSVGALWGGAPGTLQRLRDGYVDQGLRLAIGALSGRQMPSTVPLIEADQFPDTPALRARMGLK